jgi:quercetin dioxygenase-like cupin family protein
LAAASAARRGEQSGRSVSRYFPDASEFAQHAIFQGVTIQACAAEKMMLSLATLQPYAVVEEHSHPHEQVGIVIEGRALFIVGGEEKTLGPGDMYRIPGHVKHKVVALEQTVKALDIFCPIREDYR